MQAKESPSPTACMIIIGNEILSGRTQDKNLAWIAKELAELGVPLREARVIPDQKPLIIHTVNAPPVYLCIHQRWHWPHP